MDLATKDTDDLPVKLLLSHDPSHWRAEVLPNYPQIDAMFSGHTHGMQFGVRTENFQWSPVQYIYREWAGLYQEKSQQLYVNVGYGFLGYPGRVGILPEITIFELKRA
ncbi:phosphodiesterase YaeI [compost metagenome]